MKAITMSEFIPMLDELAEIWPSMTSPSRGKRYFSAICDLEKDIVQSICIAFLDRSARMPLPADFVEASRLFKASHLERHGHYYGAFKQQEKVTKWKPDCGYCYDSGFEWIEIEHNSVFCFCFCKQGDKQKTESMWMFPVSNELKFISKKVFPLRAFLPRNNEEIEPTVLGKVIKITERFNDAMNESSQFWKYYYSKNKIKEN